MFDRAVLNGRKFAPYADEFAPADSFPLEAAQWLISLHTSPIASVLELGVGAGRILSRIAEALNHLPAGQHASLHGVDLSPHMLDQARDKPYLEKATFWRDDIRSVRLGEKFSMVVCMGNTLGYTTEPDTLSAIFATAKAHLGHGGLFVLDFQDPDTLDAVLGEREYLSHFEALPGGDTGLLQFFSKPNPKLLRVHQHRVELQTVVSGVEDLALYSASEVRDAAKAVNLVSHGEFGDYLGSPRVESQSFMNVFVYQQAG